MKKKISLIYSIVLITLLTSCGSKDLNEDLNSVDLENVTQSEISNEVVTTPEPKVVTELTSDNTQIELSVGDTIQLTYSILPEDTPEQYQKVDWSSTDDTIVAVDENGILTGIENGMCTVIATSRNNPDVTIKYSVTVTGGIFTQTIITTTAPPSTQAIITTKQETQPKTTQAPKVTNAPVVTEVSTTDTTTTTIETTTIEETQATTETTTTEVITETPIEIEPTYVNGILLVNQNNPLPSSYVPSSDLTFGEYGLLMEVQQAFDTMNNDAINNGLNLTISSGYVSYEEQANRYQSAVDTYGQDYADQYVDQAGYSENQTGVSILLNSANSDFDATTEATWIAENCYKYGFIVRYPQGKESSTGKSYRSYQIRYVGVDIATDMYNQNLSLEEYLNQ